MNRSGVLAAVALTASLTAFPVAAQQMRAVGGLVVNMGITSALDAEHVDAQHGVHKGGHGSGMEHVIVTLTDDRDGGRVADADVTIEVRMPNGKVQRKPAMAMITAGFPDYSEVFDFGWSGTYVVRVMVSRKPAAKPVEAVFTVRRAF